VTHGWYAASGLTCGTYSVPVFAADAAQSGDAAWFNDLVAMPKSLPWFRYVATAAEIRQAKIDGAVAFYGHYQPVLPLPVDLGAVSDAYGRGLRSLMLTYNRADAVGVGCTASEDGGLTSYGIDLVKHCNAIGLIVDTSHCGHQTTMDACRTSVAPVNANHSCARAITDVARAKSDDALKAIADTGGVIGVVSVPFFISRERTPTIDAMLDHIDYIADLVGWQHVAIGTDFPLQAPFEIAAKLAGPALNADLGFRPEDNLDPNDTTIGFEDGRDLPNITRGLVKRGYSDEQIAGIVGENALRVFETVCG
jgi:membrane dipeptidase